MKDKFYSFRGDTKLIVNCSEIESIDEKYLDCYEIVMKSGRKYHFKDSHDMQEITELLCKKD